VRGPGRGAPGRGVAGPGRGPGRGPSGARWAGGEAGGASEKDAGTGGGAAAGAAGSRVGAWPSWPGAGAAGEGAGGAGAAAPSATVAATWSVGAFRPPFCPSAPAGTAACGRAAAFLASACFGASAENASLSLRTTGASIVEDADRTNSPISWSLAITALLSTPNSFASSYTRTFATALPYLVRLVPDPCGAGPGLCSGRRQTLLFIAAFSSGAHHDRILLSRQCRSC
jgi:hypothetical protein